MQKISVLIVDDEPLAREGIRSLLEKDPEIRISGECGSGRHAVKSIREKHPDLIFLDIQMPEMNGFEVIAALPAASTPRVIFVTAYDQYALQAFEVCAMDYLLKPFDEDRFERALQRAKKQIYQQLNNDYRVGLQALMDEVFRKKEPEAPAFLNRIVIKTEGRVFFLRAEEIDWMEAQGNYVLLHVGKESYLLRDAISKMESQLDPKRFLRIHRSTLVNIDRIKEMQSLFHGDYRVLLKDGTRLLLSRRYRWKAREFLGRDL